MGKANKAEKAQTTANKDNSDAAKGKHASKRKPKKPSALTTQDERFNHAATDPRFKRFPKHVSKVVIDSRFKGALKDKRFSTKPSVDMRGRPVVASKSEDLSRLYATASDEEDEGHATKVVDRNSQLQDPRFVLDDSGSEDEARMVRSEDSLENGAENDSQDEGEEEGKLLDVADDELDDPTAGVLRRKGVPYVSVEDGEEHIPDYARGEGLLESSDESEDDEDDAIVAQRPIEEVDLYQTVMTDQVERGEDVTHRVAICNMDWDRITASDLFVLANSFKPNLGTINSVTIYPSEFGKERMAIEEKEGPGPIIRELKKQLEDEAKAEAALASDEDSHSNNGDDDDDAKQPSKVNSAQPLGQRRDISLQGIVDSDDDDTDGDGDGSEGESEDSGQGDDGQSQSEDEGVDVDPAVSAAVDALADHDDETDDQDQQEQEELLRAYQLTRLKYYYAVVDCDSPETALAIYNGCDGLEYGRSGNIVDVRFIPDDMSFDDKPKGVATSMPSQETYEPSDYTTTALQQSRVKLTWDEDEQDRVKVTRRKFSKDEVKRLDLQDYIASESSEDEDEKVNYDAFKNLVGEIKAQREAEQPDQEIEISWDTGLRETAEKLLQKKREADEEASMTLGEKHAKKQREKRKARKQQLKQKLKAETDEAEDEEDDEDLERLAQEDPFFRDAFGPEFEQPQASSKAKKKADRRKPKENEQDEAAQQQAQLKMLIDAGAEEKHFDMSEIVKNEQRSNKTKRRRAKKKGDEVKEDDFKLDLSDGRFDAIFTSHHFSIDPTDPKFMKTKNMQRLLEEKRRRRQQEDGVVKDDANATNGSQRKVATASDGSSSDRNQDLARTITSIKRKQATAAVDNSSGRMHKPKKRKKTVKSTA